MDAGGWLEETAQVFVQQRKAGKTRKAVEWRKTGIPWHSLHMSGKIPTVYLWRNGRKTRKPRKSLSMSREITAVYLWRADLRVVELWVKLRDAALPRQVEAVDQRPTVLYREVITRLIQHRQTGLRIVHHWGVLTVLVQASLEALEQLLRRKKGFQSRGLSGRSWGWCGRGAGVSSTQGCPTAFVFTEEVHETIVLSKASVTGGPAPVLVVEELED
jgi:hypothetical protein